MLSLHQLELIERKWLGRKIQELKENQRWNSM